MKKDEALQPLRNLHDRVVEAVASLGLTVERFVIDLDGTLHIIFGVSADAVLSDFEKEQRRIDAQFALIEAGIENDAIMEQKVKNIKQDVESFMNGDDDD